MACCTPRSMALTPTITKAFPVQRYFMKTPIPPFLPAVASGLLSACSHVVGELGKSARGRFLCPQRKASGGRHRATLNLNVETLLFFDAKADACTESLRIDGGLLTSG